MKRFLQKLVGFFIPFWVGIVLLFLLPLPEKQAYSYLAGDCYNRAAWVYYRIFEEPAPIDYAFIGSSKTMHAIQDSLLSEEAHVVNLGYCRLGRNLHRVFTEDLLRERSVKAIFLEVRADENEVGHPMFPYLAGSGELLRSPVWFNPHYFRDIYLGLETKFGLYRNRLLYGRTEGTSEAGRFGFSSTDQVIDTASWNQKVERGRMKWRNGIPTPSPGQAYNIKYIDQIAALCRNSQTSLYFLYLPNPGMPLETPARLENYRPHGKVLIPPRYIFEERTYWMDTDHLNSAGAEKLTGWVKKQVPFLDK